MWKAREGRSIHRVPDLNPHPHPGVMVWDDPARLRLEAGPESGCGAEGTHQEDPLERHPKCVHQGLGRDEKALQCITIQREGPDSRRRRVEDE